LDANLPPVARIPICFDDPAVHLDKIQKWFLTHRPEVMIGRDSRTLVALRAGGIRVPEDVCFAALELDDAVSSAGFGFVNTCFAEALIQLDSLLRLNRRGIPDERNATLITPGWLTGDTLPGITTLVY
jgi:hypothetical protein